jgi:hypothetical protein
MEAKNSSETLVTTCKSTRRHTVSSGIFEYVATSHKCCDVMHVTFGQYVFFVR